MKVLYDHQVFTNQKFGGISRYFCEIISRIDCEREIAIRFSDNIYLRTNDLVPGLENTFDPRSRFLGRMEFKGKGRFFSIAKSIYPAGYIPFEEINKAVSVEKLKNHDFDVFHPTYYDDYFIPFLGNKPFVLTIHDMNHELYPEFYASREELQFVAKKEKLAREAAHIIAVSENTRNEIVNILGISMEKISVIHHAVSFKGNESDSMADLPEKYLLYVGDRGAEYKNFRFMVRALAPVLTTRKNLFVVCSGKEFDEKEKDLFRHLGIEERFISKLFADESMFSLYKNALALIFPSYAEGFGIPVIEAFKAGCPVILSNSSCFPEIAADAALYFEPKNMVGLQEQVTKVLSDISITSGIILNGYNRVKAFSWDAAASATLGVYKAVI